MLPKKDEKGGLQVDIYGEMRRIFYANLDVN
jgi:hypothetical protein